MVVFTCNNCGDSVNKPKVEKHIQYECKRKHFAVSFCCVDCLKDFNFETVKDHCQCVTEEERYSAKGFVPKASSEKGKRKQAGWVDIVQSVINRKDLPNEERQFLNVIAKFDNVPRKKNKFQNFCFSTAPAYRKKGYLVDKVFDMIEAEYKAQQVQNSTEKLADSSNIQNKSNTESLEINNTVQAETLEKLKKKKKSVINDKIENILNENEETSKKEKKKRKQSFVEVKNDEIQSISVAIENGNKKTNETPIKEKKKEKRSLDEVENEMKTKSEENIKPVSTKKKKKGNNSVAEENLDTNEKNTVQPTSKNKKKTNAETNEENGILNGNGELQISKKEKKALKKKMKYQQELAVVSSGIVEVDKEPVAKSKKRKLIGNEENEEPQQKTLKLEETQKIPEVQSQRKFDWNEVITQVLQNKKGKKTSITKVMKRVMNEYNCLNETTKKTENELEKIFLKKLRKMKNVTIDNDKVLLVGC